MTEKEYKLWQDRLRFAKDVWIRRGLIDEARIGYAYAD